MELRDDSEGGVGNIADKLIKQGLVTATEEVQHNFFKLIYITTFWGFAFFVSEAKFIIIIKDVINL